MSGLEQDLSAESGQIDDTGDADVADRRKVFVDSHSGRQRTLAQRDISDMLHDAQGSIHGDDQCVRVV